MTSTSRPLLAAAVGRLASLVIVRHFGEQIEKAAAAYELAGEVDAGRQLRSAVAQMRESARLRNLAQAETVSGVVSSEVPQSVGGADSSRPPRPGTQWLSAGEVARRLRFSKRHVTGLCESGVLRATRLESRGRPWSVDPESVDEYEEHRRSA